MRMIARDLAPTRRRRRRRRCVSVPLRSCALEAGRRARAGQAGRSTARGGAMMRAERVVVELQLAVLDEERLAHVVAAARVEHALDAARRDDDVAGDGPRAAAERRARRRRGCARSAGSRRTRCGRAACPAAARRRTARSCGRRAAARRSRRPRPTTRRSARAASRGARPRGRGTRRSPRRGCRGPTRRRRTESPLLVVGDGLPAVLAEAAVAHLLEVLARARRRRIGGVPASARCCGRQRDLLARRWKRSGISMPVTSRIVGVMSIAWQNWWRMAPRVGDAARASARSSGSRTPPP